MKSSILRGESFGECLTQKNAAQKLSPPSEIPSSVMRVQREFAQAKRWMVPSELHSILKRSVPESYHGYSAIETRIQSVLCHSTNPQGPYSPRSSLRPQASTQDDGLEIRVRIPTTIPFGGGAEQCSTGRYHALIESSRYRTHTVRVRNGTVIRIRFLLCLQETLVE